MDHSVETPAYEKAGTSVLLAQAAFVEGTKTGPFWLGKQLRAPLTKVQSRCIINVLLVIYVHY